MARSPCTRARQSHALTPGLAPFWAPFWASVWAPVLASVWASALCALASGGPALAQAIERNLPPEIAHAPAVIQPPAALPEDRDATPLGPSLGAIVVLGPTEAVRAEPARGVDLAHGGRLDTAATRRRLARFIGRPLSRKLIAEVRAAITLALRAQGYPLVSVSTPAQELSGGVLQVRVISFELERKTAPGARDPAYVTSRVRTRPGQPVNANDLAQDLDWLNRYPFRTSQAIFQPGDWLGATDLIVQSVQTRPWSVYAGYSDSGSPLTGFDRYFAGATVALPFLPDAYGSYQFTGSNDVLFAQDRPLNSAPDPLYISHSGRIVIPTLPRQDVEATVSFVQSNQFGDFNSHQTTEEASLGYRSALSNLAAGLGGEAVPGEIALGVEARHEAGSVKFLPTEEQPDQSGIIDVFQVYAGYSGQAADRFGRTALDATLHISPGGVGARNTDAALAASSQGRSTSAEYAYLSGDLSRTVGLPAGISYGLSVVGQYAPNPLPLTEQIGLGGPSLVRGYTQDDGVFDSGILARNELHAPASPLLGRLGVGVADQVAPFAFIDAGYGKNEYAAKTLLKHADESPVGAGLGADYQLGARLTAGLSAAWALKPAGATHAGQFRLESRVAVSF